MGFWRSGSTRFESRSSTPLAHVPSPGSSSFEMSRPVFSRIASNAARTRDDLSALEPPEDARDEFDELLAAIDKGVQDIRATASAARHENQQRFQEAALELSRSGQEIAEAENALKEAVDGG